MRKCIAPLLFFAVALGFCLRLSAEETPAALPCTGVLLFTNGDRLPGAAADSKTPGELAWQSPAFVEPLRFDARLLYLKEIRFDAPPAPAPAGQPYRLALMNGDMLYGRVASWGAEHFVFDSSLAGRLRVKRSEARRLERVGKESAILYSGPGAAAEWTPFPRADSWSETTGGLATETPLASLRLDLELPPRALIELKLSWQTAPDFELLLGCGKQGLAPFAACTLECADGELLVRRETQHDLDLARIMKLRSREGELRLFVVLDQARQQAEVFSADGSSLAAVKTGKDASQLLPGIFLRHRRGGLSFEQLQVSRIGDALPAEALVDAPRIQRADGVVLCGGPVEYDVQRREFRIVGDASQVCRDDQVDYVVLAPRASPKPPDLTRPDNAVLYADGTRLSGWIESIDADQLRLECRGAVDAETLEAASLPMAGVRSISFGHKVAPPTRTPAQLLLLELEDGQIHGELESVKDDAEKGRLAWKPLGGLAASAFRPDASGRIDFPATALPVRSNAAATARDRLHLRAGDVYRCQIVRINAAGVSFLVPERPVQTISHDRVKAVELGPQPTGQTLAEDKRERLLTLPRLLKDDPPTHILCSAGGDCLRGRLVEMGEELIRFEANSRPREFGRHLIARIIWLHADELDSADKPPAAIQPPAGAVQIARVDGTRVTFVPSAVEEGWISGESELLGPCRVHIEQESELLLGRRALVQAAQSPFGSWKLTSAVEPAASRVDPSQALDAAAEGFASSLVGRPASDFETELLDGARFRLSGKKGKVVVLDFWAGWCAPCMQSLPKIAQAVQAFPPDKVELVAINVQQTPHEAADALGRLKLSIPVALDREGKIAKQYGAASLPCTVVVGPEGEVARVFVGASPRLEERLAEAIRALRAPAPAAAK